MTLSTNPVTTKQKFVLGTSALNIAFENQAGTQEKALSELVQNSIDAGAKEVNVSINSIGFSVADNGNGFANEDAVRNYFQQVSFDHDTEIHSREGYVGAHGMGRLQTMVLSAANWRTNTFLMETDVKNKGLAFDFTKDLPFIQGCTVFGDWYEPLSHNDMMETVRELSRRFKYAPSKVVINDLTINSNDLSNTRPTIDNEDFSFWSAEGEGLEVVNCGTFVFNCGSLASGVLISKKALTLNTARTNVMENECAIWRKAVRAINEWNRSGVIERLKQSGKHDVNDIAFVFRALRDRRLTPNDVRNLHVIPSAKGLSCYTPNQLATAKVIVAHGRVSSLKLSDLEDNELAINLNQLNRSVAGYLYSDERIRNYINDVFALLDIEPEYDIQEFKAKSTTKNRKTIKQHIVPKNKLTAYQQCSHDAVVELIDEIQEIMEVESKREVVFTRNLLEACDDYQFLLGNFGVDENRFYVRTGASFMGGNPSLSDVLENLFDIMGLAVIDCVEEISNELPLNARKAVIKASKCKSKRLGSLVERVTLKRLKSIEANKSLKLGKESKALLDALTNYQSALESFKANLEK